MLTACSQKTLIPRGRRTVDYQRYGKRQGVCNARFVVGRGVKDDGMLTSSVGEVVRPGGERPESTNSTPSYR